jgi:hypothetical protein
MKWPWVSVREQIEEGVQYLRMTRDLVAGTYDKVHTPTPKPINPDPFVVILAQGKDANEGNAGDVFTLGATARVKTSFYYVDLMTDVSLKDGQVIVFCDLEQVRVTQIQLGNMPLAFGMGIDGQAPVAQFRRWDVSFKMRVYLQKVEQ